MKSKPSLGTINFTKSFALTKWLISPTYHNAGVGKDILVCSCEVFTSYGKFKVPKILR